MIIVIESVKQKILIMKKITNKTRVKIYSGAIYKELGLKNWDFNKDPLIYKYMYNNFDMRFTSKRLGVYYFSIGDKAKYSLFLLKHHDLMAKW